MYPSLPSAPPYTFMPPMSLPPNHSSPPELFPQREWSVAYQLDQNLNFIEGLESKTKWLDWFFFSLVSLRRLVMFINAVMVAVFIGYVTARRDSGLWLFALSSSVTCFICLAVLGGVWIVNRKAKQLSRQAEKDCHLLKCNSEVLEIAKEDLKLEDRDLLRLDCAYAIRRTWPFI